MRTRLGIWEEFSCRKVERELSESVHQAMEWRRTMSTIQYNLEAFYQPLSADHRRATRGEAGQYQQPGGGRLGYACRHTGPVAGEMIIA